MSFLDSPSRRVRIEGLQGAAIVARPSPAIIVVTLVGHADSNLVDALFHEIETDLALQAPLQLFIDAGDATAASMSASHVWASCLEAHRGAIARVTMLASSRLSHIVSDFVRSASGLGDAMVVLDDPAAFERALSAHVWCPRLSATWRREAWTVDPAATAPPSTSRGGTHN